VLALPNRIKNEQTFPEVSSAKFYTSFELLYIFLGTQKQKWIMIEPLLVKYKTKKYLDQKLNEPILTDLE